MWDTALESAGTVFKATLRPPKKPEKPSDGAISAAQRSYDGHEVNGETLHVITRRFPTVEAADAAEDEIKRAGAYTTPETSVRTARDPEGIGDARILAFVAGNKRGRKPVAETPKA